MKNETRQSPNPVARVPCLPSSIVSILEACDKLLQGRGKFRKPIRRPHRVACPLRCIPRRDRHARDVLSNFVAAKGRLSHVAANLARGRGLLLYGTCDCVLEVVDLVDDLANLTNRL